MKTRNRKKHSRRSKRTKSLGHDFQETARALREKENRLSEEILSLEEVLASLEAKEENRKQMRRENVMPPPQERWASHHRNPKLSKAQQRRITRERDKSVLRFFLLFLIACALAFYLFQF